MSFDLSVALPDEWALLSRTLPSLAHYPTAIALRLHQTRDAISFFRAL